MSGCDGRCTSAFDCLDAVNCREVERLERERDEAQRELGELTVSHRRVRHELNVLREQRDEARGCAEQCRTLRPTLKVTFPWEDR